MYLTAEKKKELFKKYGSNEKDTGATGAQIALFSQRISHLTSHLKTKKNDNHARRSLMKLVGKRRRLLDYLKSKDIEKYRAIIKELKLRK